MNKAGNNELSQASSIAFFPSVSAEDRARADMYALLSRLFYAAPDESLLRALAAAAGMDAEGDDVSLATAWHELTTAAALADVEEARFEYDILFIGTGKADVTLYSTAYLKGITHNGAGAEKQLAALRGELADIGIIRHENVHEPEDHFSALCDVMRFLIVGDSETPAGDVERQREFFHSHIASWFVKLADAIEANKNANFYRPAGRFLRAFLDLENESLKID
ncbi:MAG: molecular chaperone TorD family protein [Burkholderiales bacterium]|nr:molecular chaperone TorD family protein [Burkholderiales bacterium]